jgi:hypothetical protein
MMESLKRVSPALSIMLLLAILRSLISELTWVSLPILGFKELSVDFTLMMRVIHVGVVALFIVKNNVRNLDILSPGRETPVGRV